MGENDFEEVERFCFLGTIVIRNNEYSTEINTRVTAGNTSIRCTLMAVIRNNNVSGNIKIKIYETVIRPVVIYVSETWTMSGKDKENLEIWE